MLVNEKIQQQLFEDFKINMRLYAETKKLKYLKRSREILESAEMFNSQEDVVKTNCF